MEIDGNGRCFLATCYTFRYAPSAILSRTHFQVSTKVLHTTLQHQIRANTPRHVNASSSLNLSFVLRIPRMCFRQPVFTCFSAAAAAPSAVHGSFSWLSSSSKFSSQCCIWDGDLGKGDLCSRTFRTWPSQRLTRKTDCHEWGCR